MIPTPDKALPKRSRAGLLDLWTDALTGPRRHAAVVVSLAAYGAIWTAYRLMATLPRDIHFDMSELYAMSLAPALGTDKHPPLSAWMVHAWFALFPVNDLSFTLLTALNIVLTLYIVWRVLDRWTDPAKAAFGLALLPLVPFFNFQALKYNANTVLLPVWAFAGYAFLRAFESREALWSVLAGLAAGAAMLGKYWSIFLVAGFVLAALVDTRKRAFFLSAAPYLMVLAGAAAFAPHVAWLVEGNGETLGYASQRVHGDGPLVLPALGYFGGVIGYAALAVAVWALLLRPRGEALWDVANPPDPQRTLMLLCFALPNLLPLLAAPWLGSQLTPLWALPGYALLPLVLLASPMIAVDRRALRRAVAIAAGVSVVSVLASPLVALAIHARSNPRPADYGAMLARDVASRWAETSAAPLRQIASCGARSEVAYAVAYDLRLPSRILFGRQEQEARASLLKNGGAIVGAADDPDCAPTGVAIAQDRPNTKSYTGVYRAELFGAPGRPFSYRALIVPPP